jgi:hypothetical protein
LVVFLRLVLIGTHILANCHTTTATINIVSFFSFIWWISTVFPHVRTLRFSIWWNIDHYKSRSKNCEKRLSALPCLYVFLSVLSFVCSLRTTRFPWTDFNEILYLRNFENLLEKSSLIKIWQAQQLLYMKTNVHLCYLAKFFLEYVSDKPCRENQTHFSSVKLFFENYAFMG